MRFSQDGFNLVSGGKDHVIRILDLRMMKQRQFLKGHNNEVTALSFHPDHPNVIVSGDHGGRMHVWGLPFNTPVCVLEHLNEEIVQNRLKMNKNSSFGTYGFVDVTSANVERGTGIGKFNPMVLVINQVQFSPNGSTIASLGNDRFIQFWQ